MSSFPAILAALTSALYYTLQVTTVTVDGQHDFRFASDNVNVVFHNVPFEISAGANFYFELKTNGRATFARVTGMVSTRVSG